MKMALSVSVDKFYFKKKSNIKNIISLIKFDKNIISLINFFFNFLIFLV